MVEPSIRRAVSRDAALVARLQVEVWEQAYTHLLPTAVLAELAADPVAHQLRWADRLANGGPVLIAAEGESIVGFAAVSVSPVDLPDAPAAGELESLAVLPRFQRRGHGGRLLAAAAAELRRGGAQSGFCWAPRSDIRMARFLVGAGWPADGRQRTLDTGAGLLTEVRHAGGVDLIAV